MIKKRILIFLLGFFVWTYPFNAFADVMSSENYKVYSDVLSVGGNYSTSTNYGLFDTVGEAGAYPTSSTGSSFEIQSGFGGANPSVLSVSLSNTMVNLGTIDKNNLNTLPQTITVSTNSSSGYTTTIQADGPLTSGTNTISAVSDGSVTAGSSEYGIRTTGNNAQMNSSDTGLSTSPQTLAQATAAVSADQTTITYKVAISASVPTGNYSQTVTFTTTVNF